MRAQRLRSRGSGQALRTIMRDLCANVAICIALVWASPGSAQSVTDFYARTSIRLIVSADPGGSYDQIGRLVSRHLGRHIPGNPRVVRENMLGASGRVAANFLYRTAPQDGSVI